MLLYKIHLILLNLHVSFYNLLDIDMDLNNYPIPGYTVINTMEYYNKNNHVINGISPLSSNFPSSSPSMMVLPNELYHYNTNLVSSHIYNETKPNQDNIVPGTSLAAQTYHRRTISDVHTFHSQPQQGAFYTTTVIPSPSLLSVNNQNNHSGDGSLAAQTYKRAKHQENTTSTSLSTTITPTLSSSTFLPIHSTSTDSSSS